MTRIRNENAHEEHGKSAAWVAIGKQLRHCPEVLTLGVRPSFADYEDWEREYFLAGRTVYFPTRRFVDHFHCHGVKTYPNWRDYHYIGDKFEQTQLFQLLGIPHPRTRLYWTRNRKSEIERDFAYPFIAKKGRRSSRGKGIFLIRSPEDLEKYCQENRFAYIQEYMPIKRSARVVLLAGHVISAYWLVAPEGSILTNLCQGGDISDETVPGEVLTLARQVAVRCGFDEVGVDIIKKDGECYVLEANLLFGTEGLKRAGLTLAQVRRDMLLQGLI